MIDLDRNPGEYIGKDGRTYRWLYSDVMGWIVRDERGCVTGMKREDVTDAKAALDALIDAESMGWVAIDDNARIQADGSDPQVRHEGGICCWRGLTNPIDKRWPKAYRKGREVAQAEQADLRDDVRELVEAVTVASRCGVDYGGIVVNRAWFDYAVTAAKKVEAKL